MTGARSSENRAAPCGTPAACNAICAAVALILIGKIETVLIERVRSHFSDGVAPILEVLSEPIRLARAGAEHIADLADLIEENERLSQENARLLQTVQRADHSSQKVELAHQARLEAVRAECERRVLEAADAKSLLEEQVVWV